MIHRTKCADFEARLLIRAPMEILNWVATVAGLRRIDRFMLPSGKRVLRSGCWDWNITWKKRVKQEESESGHLKVKVDTEK